MVLRLTFLCALLAALVLGAVAPAHAARSQPLYFDAPELRDPAAREATLDELQSLGVRAVRIVLYWQDVAPDPARNDVPAVDLTDPAAYAWGGYDDAIGAAHARGMRVLVTLTTPGPRWGTRDKLDGITRPLPEHFKRFAEAAGRRYGDRVSAWAAINEPNHPDFLGPQYAKSGRPLSPPIYRGLYRAMVAGLEASGNRRDTMLMGETAPRGTGRVVHPITFLRGSLCLTQTWRRAKRCGALRVDGWAHHPYTTKIGPWFEPPSENDVTIGVLSRLTLALDRATRAPRVPAPLEDAAVADRVRHPVDARPVLGRVAGQAARVPRDLRADGVVQPRVRARSRSTCCATTVPPTARRAASATAGSSRGCGSRPGARSRRSARSG